MATNGHVSPERQWWKSAAVYQIYPASFKDSNGDGIGDLPGILSKLDYLKSIGIDAIWISPFYESPNYDMGYDISDYQKPDPAYGKLEDIDAVIKGAHDRGLKILFDLVINHTSHLHPWFKDAESSKDSKYRDYYIWRPPRYIDGKRCPPTNWLSCFQESPWEWSEKTGEYYLHLFTKEQPDLNWEVPEVRQHIYDEAITFWLKRGVDGFRVDTSALYSKHPFEDVPVVDPYNYEQPSREVQEFGPRLGEFLQEMHRETFAKYGSVTIAELGGDLTTPKVLDMVAQAQGKFSMAIRFDIVNLDHGDFYLLPKEMPLSTFKEAQTLQQELAIPEHDAWLCNYLENHDQARCVSRFADDSPEHRVASAKMLAVHMITQSGTLLLYQGQEIGMINMPKDWPIEEYLDPLTIIYWQKVQKAVKDGRDYTLDGALKGAQKLARDHARTPMQWSGESQAGFTSGNKPWMRVMDSYKEINVVQQEEDPSSVLNFWRQALKLRKQYQELFVFGRFKLLEPTNEKTMLYTKQSFDAKRPLAFVALNFSAESQPFAWPSEAEGEPKLILGTRGEQIDLRSELRPWEGRVYLFE